MVNDFISEDAFMDDYRPITLGADGDQVVQSYGQAQLTVQDMALSDQHIWAIVENGEDGSLFASPGYHAVNTIGFVVTEKPWESEMVDALWHDASEDLDEDEMPSFGLGM